MKRISLYSRAKVNLSLDITGKRPDGYHTVKMIMQTIDLADHVVVQVGQAAEQISVHSNLYYLPNDRRNIAYRAAELFLQKTGCPNRGITIHIGKKIPVAAGLAGGSTNAASVLLGLNRLYGTGLSRAELMELGLQLGADVPFCLLGGTALAEGIGEELTPLPSMKPMPLVLCKPPFSVSTKLIYSKIQVGKINHRPDTCGMIEALENQDELAVAQRLYNVMETVTSPLHKEIGEIKTCLLRFGAAGAVMSGSGPSVFGLFQRDSDAKKAHAELLKRYPDTFLTRISPEQVSV